MIETASLGRFLTSIRTENLFQNPGVLLDRFENFSTTVMKEKAFINIIRKIFENRCSIDT